MAEKMKHMDGIKVVRRWGFPVFALAFFILLLAANVTFAFFFPFFSINDGSGPYLFNAYNFFYTLLFFDQNLLKMNPVFEWTQTIATENDFKYNVALVSQWLLFALAIFISLIALFSVILVIKALVLILGGKSHQTKGAKNISVSLFIFYLLTYGGSFGFLYYLKWMFQLNNYTPAVQFEFPYWNLIPVGVSFLLMIIIIIIHAVSFKNAIYSDEAKVLSKQIEMTKSANVDVEGQSQGDGNSNSSMPNVNANNQPSQKIIITKHQDTMPQNVRHIGGHEYSNNQYLVIANIPSGVPSIGIGAFANCLNLKVVSIPKSVKKIKANAFFNTPRLERISYEGTKEDWSRINRGTNWLTKAGTSVVVCVNGSIIVDPLK